jgi:hypothetical protein
MIVQKNNISYYYDPIADSLNLYLGRAEKIYSNEECKGVYFIRDEITDNLIGVEILYYSTRNKLKLKETIPVEFDFVI